MSDLIILLSIRLGGREIWSQRVAILPRIGELLSIMDAPAGCRYSGEGEKVYGFFRVKGVLHELGCDASIGGDFQHCVIEVERVGTYALRDRQEATGYTYPDSLTGKPRTEGKDSIFEMEDV